MIIKIKKPHDGNDYWETSMRFADAKNYWDDNSVVTIRPMGGKDPVHGAIYNHFLHSFSGKHFSQTKLFNTLPRNNVTLMIGDTPIHIRKAGRYYLNGKLMTVKEMSHALARVLFKSCFEKDPVKLLPYLYATLELPEEIRYVIENRLPYWFYDDFQKHQVRLNVMQISKNECAIEIGDGLWGNITVKELQNFCKWYIDGNKRSKWKYTSPKELYSALLGKEPLSSDVKVLVAFLKQNRKKDIVERRANELVKEMLEEYPDRLMAKYTEGVLTELFVRGKVHDWRLSYNGGSSANQAVKTYVWQPTRYDVTDEDGNPTGAFKFENPNWKGSICIDNLGASTPIGDQFASRALSLLNDSHTMKIVNTIKTYIVDSENEYRIEWK